MAFFLPILLFHTIDERPSAISLSPGVFRRGMAELYTCGHRALNPPDMLDVLSRGAPIFSFAYPFGRYNRLAHDIVRRHFKCAFSDKLGLIDRFSDPYALERVDAYYLRTDRLFRVMLSRLFPLYVTARAMPRRIRRAFQKISGRR